MTNNIPDEIWVDEHGFISTMDNKYLNSLIKTKYHHDDKYQKAIEALKDLFFKLDLDRQQDVIAEARQALKELGEI